ncbi:hypothetical protein SCHPADRAFT_940674 [Schizopora paradoxa]|uniref:DUF6534 domain-containing protein n=1 Tax=Schizopora paradoxa TaxID=27342 RepID=A0A0H2RUH5_9AGAM|nr:hypothetical protein SCHPADRAFT_940674 [Schizopora paradoxa]
MSIANFTPGYVMKHPNDFLGPVVASAIIQGIELGIIVNQALQFFSRIAMGKKETRYVKITAVATIVIMMFQTSLAFENLYRVTVKHFGDWVAVINVNWVFKIDPLLMGLMAAPVQAFFIRRCWLVMGKKWYILAPLSFLLLANIVSLVTVTVYVFTLTQAKIILNPPKHLPYYCANIKEPHAVILFYVFSVSLDLSVTGIMLWYIIQARSIAISRRTTEILSRLTFTLWEAVIPPSVCAIIGMAVFLTRGNHDFWEIFVQGCVGKLYVISLFTVLNGRPTTLGAELPTHSSSGTSSDTSNNKFQSIKFMRGSRQTDTGIKVNMTTEVDTDRTVLYDTYELKTSKSRRSGQEDSEVEP